MVVRTSIANFDTQYSEPNRNIWDIRKRRGANLHAWNSSDESRMGTWYDNAVELERDKGFSIKLSGRAPVSLGD